MSADAEVRWRVEDEADLGVLFEEAFDSVYRYAARLTGTNRALAEDLVQDAFVQLLRAVRAGSVSEVGTGWLTTSIRNRFIDHVRRDRIMLGGVPADAAVTGADAEQASAGLDRLDALSRLVLTLHHVDGWSVREVAASIGKSESATESLLVRARRAARQIMERQVER